MKKYGAGARRTSIHPERNTYGSPASLGFCFRARRLPAGRAIRLANDSGQASAGFSQRRQLRLLLRN